MTLKQTISAFSFTMLLSMVIAANVCGQALVVTGHVNAEVVESAHASSKVITDSDLKNEQFNAVYIQQNGTSQNSDILSVGAVAISAGVNVACSIKLNEANISDTNGNRFTIEPASITSGRSDTLQADGSQTLLLKGTASLTHGFTSKLYSGSYSVVVLYN